MNGIKSIIALVAFITTASLATAADYPVSEPKVTIPIPPMGERWVLNDEYSDEFNGDKLDDNKWYDRFPNWAGRPPGMFLEENVSVSDGCLQIKGGKLDTPVIVGSGDDASIYDISCGSIASKGATAHFGYYEARAKANKTSLSTTFWLLSRGKKLPVKGYQPEGMTDGTFGQELDICETIGRGGTEDEGWSKDAAKFHKGMNSNVHCWLNPTDGGSVDMVIPKIPGARPADGKIMSDDFQTYGCWWYDKSSAEFYLNNVSNGGRINFVSTTDQEFYVGEPMSLNVWVETYRWIPKPVDEDLLDPSKNTSYFDWIRHYVLVDIDDKSVKAAPEQTNVFEDYVYFTKREADEAKFEIIYIAPVDRTIILEIYDDADKLVCSKEFTAYAGFGANEYVVDHAKLRSGKKYTVVALFNELLAPRSTKHICGDSFSFVAK